MNQSMWFYKKCIALIVLYCTIGTTSQAIDLGSILNLETQVCNHENIDNFFYYNNLLLLSKGGHYAMEAFRILNMNSTNKQTIQAAAIASVITSALVIGTKLFAAYKQKWAHQAMPIPYIYPFFSIARSFFDLVKSTKIAKNAKIIAINNKKNNKKMMDMNNTIMNTLLGILVAEAGCSLSTHKAILDTKENASNFKNQIYKTTHKTENNQYEAEEIWFKFKDVGASTLCIATGKICSFIIWAIRHSYESKYLNTTQFATNLDYFQDETITLPESADGL